MRRITLPTVLCLLFLFPLYVNAQTAICRELQGRLDKAEKRDLEIGKQKLPLEDFISLMEDPHSGIGSVSEELAIAEGQIRELQKQITAGDNSAETAAALQSLRTRTELMKLRVSKDFNEKTFFNNPKYLQLQKTLDNLKQTETENKREIADLGQEMTNNNCPKAGKKFAEDIGDLVSEIGTTDWTGNWKYSDEENGTVNMKLNGSGTSVTGSASNISDNESGKFEIKNCRENGAGKLACSFTAVYEDEDKFLDAKGTVELTLATNTITSVWREAGAPAVRWKPGHEMKGIARVRDAVTLRFTFKKN